MNAQVLRLLWSVILEISTDKITGLSDDVLERSLLGMISSRCCLSQADQVSVKCYLKARKPLIREMLQGNAL